MEGGGLIVAQTRQGLENIQAIGTLRADRIMFHASGIIRSMFDKTAIAGRLEVESEMVAPEMLI